MLNTDYHDATLSPSLIQSPIPLRIGISLNMLVINDSISSVNTLLIPPGFISGLTGGGGWWRK